MDHFFFVFFYDNFTRKPVVLVPYRYLTNKPGKPKVTGVAEKKSKNTYPERDICFWSTLYILCKCFICKITMLGSNRLRDDNTILQIVKDTQLFLMVGILLCIDLGIMFTWQFSDPFYRETKQMESYVSIQNEIIAPLSFV